MLGFRVWDSIGKKMIYPNLDKIDDPDFLLGPDGSLLLPYTNHRTPESYIPMQSTGIKDSNEIAIFEGDVIKISHNETQEIRDVKDIIDFHMTYAQFYYVFGEFTIDLIGNIYENPELL